MFANMSMVKESAASRLKIMRRQWCNTVMTQVKVNADCRKQGERGLTQKMRHEGTVKKYHDSFPQSRVCQRAEWPLHYRRGSDLFEQLFLLRLLINAHSSRWSIVKTASESVGDGLKNHHEWFTGH